MAKKTKVKNDKKPTKVKISPITRIKTEPMIMNQIQRFKIKSDSLSSENERLRHENDSIKKVLKGNIDVKIK